MTAAALKLPAALEKFITEQLERGTYRSHQAAIVAAVAGERRCVDRLAWLTAATQEGLDSGHATAPLNMEDVIRRGRGRLWAGQ